jgi:hypothetical protein
MQSRGGSESRAIAAAVHSYPAGRHKTKRLPEGGLFAALMGCKPGYAPSADLTGSSKT